jgi:Tfp pilus assembly protein PilF
LQIALEERVRQLVNAKQWAKAADRLRELVELEPGRSEAHDNLAYVLVQQGDPAAALEEFRKALAADPRDEAARRGIERLAK